MSLISGSYHQIAGSAGPVAPTNSHHRTKVGADYYDEAGDAREREAYYAPVADRFEKSDGKSLFQDLHGLLESTHRPLSGLPGEPLYTVVDRRPDGALYPLYSGEGPKNEEQAPKRNERDLEGYNLEHLVPKSWFDSELPMRDDLHHLFTENRQCNSDRGNLPLRDIKGKARELSDCKSRISANEFEPGHGKGEAARAIMYFVTRHPGLVGDAPGEMTTADIPMLLKWHREFPVTDYERHRNETIQDFQGNRNPYIDHPELAERVDLRAGFGS